MLGQAMPRLRTDIRVFKINQQPFAKARHRFNVKKKLGQGAFGAAFAATLNGKNVIVKTAVGTPGLVSPMTAMDSMAHEVKVLARLQKFPFVPRLIEVGTDYFVQEDVGGVSMLHILTGKGLEAREILSVVVSSGVILSQLHKEGVAHNDFEARNILLTPAGVVAIDFGIAVLREEDGEVKFREALGRDIVSMLENVVLAMSAKDVPPSIRVMLASTIEDYRKKLIAERVDEDTAANLSRELLFALAQLGALAKRGSKVGRERLKVIAV